MVNALGVLLVLGQLGTSTMVGVLTSTLPGFFEKTEEIRETREVKPGTPLTVTNANGDILLRGWNKDYVEIHAIKKTHYGKDELAKVRVEVLVGEKMEIRTQHLEKNARVSVDYDIKIPYKLIVRKLFTSNGNIELEGTTGDTEAVTSNGDIELRNVAGTVQVRTSNGNIDIRGTSTIREATTSNGEVRAEIHSLAEDGATITTSNGSIDLHIDDKLNADLSSATSMGKVSLKDLFLHSRFTATSETSTLLKGKIGEGGRLINAHTANGDIRLSRMGE